MIGKYNFPVLFKMIKKLLIDETNTIVECKYNKHTPRTADYNVMHTLISYHILTFYTSQVTEEIMV